MRYERIINEYRMIKRRLVLDDTRARMVDEEDLEDTRQDYQRARLCYDGYYKYENGRHYFVIIYSQQRKTEIIFIEK